uniref:Uncharacterized protein n=1 Tax=Anguilla anguilla TaxID=7936 RepID=A0A0E9PEG5_ANGAN
MQMKVVVRLMSIQVPFLALSQEIRHSRLS